MDTDINIYPTYDMVVNGVPKQNVIDMYVDFIIEELYFARRVSGEDIVKLAKLAKDKISKL